ncbi:hypothetical protein FOVSG1_004993 [Fusarium oxysporum f. sp. vasinfectum]
MSTFTNRGETFFNRCGLTDAVGDDAGWAPGQDPGFGELQDSSDEPDSGGGTVPALEDTCPNGCWNVSDDKKIKCVYDGMLWDMEDRDDDIPDDRLNIKKLAAIGDSYSAGIGARDRLGSIFDALKEGSGYLDDMDLCSGELRATTTEEAVDRAGDSVKFINYDQYVGKYGGRFCEAGVDESTSESNTRKGLMFYELNSWDLVGTSPWKRGTGGGELNGTFYGDMLILGQITRLLDPNAELHHDGDEAKKALAARAGIFDYLIPDGYGRVFHPQIALHEMIASLVIYEIMLDHQARIGYAVWTPPPENTSCKTAKPSPTPSAPPKPPPPPTRPTLIPLPPFEPKYDCKGSKLCSGPLLRLKDCDHAVNYLRRETDPPFEYSTEKDHLNGNCWGKSDGIGCGVFLEGEGCEMRGYDMWDWYQKIRKDGSCKKCGKVEYKDGCTLKIDYVTGCNNHG